MPHLLELFSGTGSVGKAFKQLGWLVTSLDIEGTPDIKLDILDWRYQELPPSYFDAIHASPPCTQYSKARTTAKTPRDLDGADKLVQKTLEIIAYLNPSVWIIENPFTGLLKTRPCMEPIEHLMRVITYCKYGSPYRKSTSIWSNLEDKWRPLPPCTRYNPCRSMVDGHHPQTAQRAPGKTNGVRRASASDSFSQDQLYALPPALCYELAQAASRVVAAAGSG